MYQLLRSVSVFCRIRKSQSFPEVFRIMMFFFLLLLLFFVCLFFSVHIIQTSNTVPGTTLKYSTLSIFLHISSCIRKTSQLAFSKSISDFYRPNRIPVGSITLQYRFKQNAMGWKATWLLVDNVSDIIVMF